MREDALLRAGAVEVDADLVERDAERLHREPRPQRPGRVVLVADDQLHVQSMCAPEARMIGAHLASSALMNSAVFSGVCPGVGSTPVSCSRLITAGSAIACAMKLASCATIRSGVFAGARIAFQV